jgi:hypothetical protein
MSTEAIDYRAVLADLEKRCAKLEEQKVKLEKQKVEIDAMIKGVKAILSDTTVAGANVGANGKSPFNEPEILPNSFAGMTTVEAAKAFLGMSQSKRTTAEIVHALRRGGLKPASTNSVYVILHKAMKKKGIFVRQHQLWALNKKPTDAREEELEESRKAKLNLSL